MLHTACYITGAPRVVAIQGCRRHVAVLVLVQVGHLRLEVLDLPRERLRAVGRSLYYVVLYMQSVLVM